MLLAGGGVQQAAGGQQPRIDGACLHTPLGQQIRNLQGQMHVEGIAQGARAHQHPVIPFGLGNQGTAGGVQFHVRGLGLGILDAPGQP